MMGCRPSPVGGNQLPLKIDMAKPMPIGNTASPMRVDNRFGWLDLHRTLFVIRPELSSAALHKLGKLVAKPESSFSRRSPIRFAHRGISDLT